MAGGLLEKFNDIEKLAIIFQSSKKNSFQHIFL